jgi:hypothetical protein
MNDEAIRQRQEPAATMRRVATAPLDLRRAPRIEAD